MILSCERCGFVRSDRVPDCCPLCGDSGIRVPVVLAQRGDDIDRQRVLRVSFDDECMYIHCEGERQ